MPGQDTHLTAAVLTAAAQMEEAAMVVARWGAEHCKVLCRLRGWDPWPPNAQNKGIYVGRRGRLLVEGIVPLEQALNPVDLMAASPSPCRTRH